MTPKVGPRHGSAVNHSGRSDARLTNKSAVRAAACAVVFCIGGNPPPFVATATDRVAPERTVSAATLDSAFEDPILLVGGYQVFATLTDTGGSPGPGRVVRASLRDAHGDRLATASAVTDAFGAIEFDFTTQGHSLRQPVTLRAGHVIELRSLGADGAAAPEASARIEVLPLSARPDVDSDEVTGTAPPGVRVQVTASVPGGSFASVTADSTPDGKWTAELGDSIDLVAGAGGAAFFEADGVFYQTEWAARRVEGAIGSGSVSVKTWAGDVVHADLYNSGGVRVAAGDAVAWSGGSESTPVALRDGAGNLVPLTPGARLEIRYGDGDRFEETLPPLSIEVDTVADRVEIITAPGAELRATLAGMTATATAGADGKASLEFGAIGVDLDLTTAVDIQVVGSTLATTRAFVPAIEDIDPLVVGVKGRGVAGDAVALTVELADREVRATADGRIASDGRFVLIPRDDDGRQIALGDSEIGAVQLMLDGRAIDLPIDPLLASAQASRDTVEGSGEPGQSVSVEAGGVRLEAIADADGRWKADFTDQVDLRPGLPVTVARGESEGIPTHLTFPVFRATAQLNSGRVRIEGHPGLDATIELARDGETIAAGRCTVERSRCEAHLEAEDGDEVRIAAEDVVSVYPDEGSSASLDIVALTAHIDLSGFDVTGASPPEESVAIAFKNDQGIATPLDTSINSDATGVYDYELSSGQYDLLVPGLSAEVTYDMADGNRVMAVGVVEVLRVDVGAGGAVTGLAEPGSIVSLRMEPGGSGEDVSAIRSLARASGDPLVATSIAGPDGGFRFDLPSRGDGLPAILPGDQLELNHARGTITLDVPSIGAWRATVGGAVAGLVSPSDTVVRVLHRLLAIPDQMIPPGRDSTDVYPTAGLVGPSGAFRIEPPSMISAIDVRTLEVVIYPARSTEVRIVILGRGLGHTIFLPSASSR